MKKINWMYLAQVLVTGAASFMSAMFNTQHGVLPPLVAWPLAIGFEAIYLSGLIAADRTVKSRWSTGMIVAASLTSFVYGLLYVLGVYGVVPEKPGGWIAFGLALAHVLPMPVLSLCAARLYHASRAHVLAAQRATEEAERLRIQSDKDAEVARNQKWRDAELERRLRNEQEEDRLRIENARKDAELARWQAEQATKAQHRALVAAQRSRNQNATVSATARTVIYDGVEYPNIKAAADAHGISRQAMTKRLAKLKEAS
jgi:hypothetical protein